MSCISLFVGSAVARRRPSLPPLANLSRNDYSSFPSQTVNSRSSNWFSERLPPPIELRSPPINTNEFYGDLPPLSRSLGGSHYASVDWLINLFMFS